MKILYIFLMLWCITPVVAQEPTKIGSDAIQTFFSIQLPEELKNKQWNRWTTKNFVICSINDGQAQYLHSNLEKIKEWLLTRWGFENFDFKYECRLICVDDPVLYKKMFGIDKSKVEFKDNLVVIFLLLNDKPAKTVPLPLTEACLVQLEKSNNIKFPLWFHRSMALLNGSISDIRNDLTILKSDIDKDTPMFFGDDLLKMTEDKFIKLAPEQQALFDRNSLAFTLMVRKELGQAKLIDCLKTGQISDFTPAQLDIVFKNYMVDLTNDIVGASKKMTPDSYLQIKRD